MRKKGVVGKFVEFFGPGLHDLSIADRATIGNMAPEYGATCGFFPIDEVTLDYLRLSGRDEQTIALVEAYAKTQGLWHDAIKPEPCFYRYCSIRFIDLYVLVLLVLNVHKIKWNCADLIEVIRTNYLQKIIVAMKKENRLKLMEIMICIMVML